MAQRVYDLGYSGGEFGLIARLSTSVPFGSLAAAKVSATGLWRPGFTFVFASGRMEWFATHDDVPYSELRPFVVD